MVSRWVLLVALAGFHFSSVNLASASDEIEIDVQTNNAIGLDVSISFSDGSVSDCRSLGGDVGTAGVRYFCNIPSSDYWSSLGECQAQISSSSLDVEPIRLRLFPTMNIPLKLRFDLRDPVFYSNFQASKDYYNNWILLDNRRPPSDFNFYLITRNLLSKLPFGFDSSRLYVLRRWIERSLTTVEHLPYQAVDVDAIKAFEQTNDSAKNQSEKDTIASAGIKNDDLNSLKLGDWYVFVIALKAYNSEIERRHDDFCRLYSTFKQKWDDAGDEVQSKISDHWRVSGTAMKDPNNFSSFRGCHAS